MRGMENCSKGSCIWAYRFEVVGLALIILGVFLTMAYGSDIGVGVLILVGGALCLRNHLGRCHCHYHNGNDDMDCCDMPVVTKTHSETIHKPVVHKTVVHKASVHKEPKIKATRPKKPKV